MRDPELSVANFGRLMKIVFVSAVFGALSASGHCAIMR